MTAASIVTLFPGTISASDAPLLDVVARARNGETDALLYVFDNVFYDVYHDVFLDTLNRREAERVTREALARLPRMLRSGRYASIEELRESLVSRARQRAQTRPQPGASVDGLESLRAVVRHVVLTITASIAAVGVVILAV